MNGQFLKYFTLKTNTALPWLTRSIVLTHKAIEEHSWQTYVSF